MLACVCACAHICVYVYLNLNAFSLFCRMQKMGPIWEACLKSDKMEKYVIAVLEKEQKKKRKKNFAWRHLFTDNLKFWHTHRSVWWCQCRTIAVWFLLRYFFINRSAVMEMRKVHVLLLPCPHPSPTVSLSDFKLFPASDFQIYNSGNKRVFCMREEIDQAKKKKKMKRCFGICQQDK